MRCKPGDLCVVVSGNPAINIGRFVTVTRPFVKFGLVLWAYEGRLVNEAGGPIFGIADDCLQPIRPPGAATSTPTHAEDFAHG